MKEIKRRIQEKNKCNNVKRGNGRIQEKKRKETKAKDGKETKEKDEKEEQNRKEM